MDICLVTPELPPYVRGGIGTYVLELARGYAARGHHATIVGYQLHPEDQLDHAWGRSISLGGLDAGIIGSATAWANARVDSAVASAREAPGFWRLHRMRSNARTGRIARTAALAVRDYLQRGGQGYDVVEISNWLGHGAFVPSIRGAYVVRVSTPSVLFGVGAMRAVTRLEAQTCAYARRIIAHSEAVKQSAVKYYHVDPAKVAVVSLGVADCVSGPPPASDHVELLYIGRAEHRKGTDVLLRALDAALPANPSLRITFAGADVESFVSVDQELTALWSNLKARFADRIRAIPPVSDAEKIDLLAASHWLLVPSRYESFGLVAVEAMRSGTPVIAAAVGGLAEVAARAPTSRTYQAEDREALAAQLAAVAQLGPTAALGLRAATRATYEEWFRPERMVDESLAQYRRAINE